MNRVNRDIVWRLLTTLVVDILNPTLVISLALFVSVGYILTLLMPVTIEIWLAVFCLTLLPPLAGLVVLAGRKWKKNEISAKRFSWRVFLPFMPLIVFSPAFFAKFTYPIAQISDSWRLSTRLYIPSAIWIHTNRKMFFLPGHPANYVLVVSCVYRRR